MGRHDCLGLESFQNILLFVISKTSSAALTSLSKLRLFPPTSQNCHRERCLTTRGDDPPPVEGQSCPYCSVKNASVWDEWLTGRHRGAHSLSFTSKMLTGAQRETRSFSNRALKIRLHFDVSHCINTWICEEHYMTGAAANLDLALRIIKLADIIWLSAASGQIMSPVSLHTTADNTAFYLIEYIFSVIRHNLKHII